MAAEDLDAIIGRLNHMALSQEEPDVQRERYLRSFRSFYARHAWRRLAPVSCVLAISDVHADAVANAEWLTALPSQPDAALIVAGDVTHDLDLLEKTICELVGKFKHTFYCIGNHELWAISKDGNTDAIEKMLRIYELVHRCGAHAAPALLGDADNGDGCAIVPLQSWYHSHFLKARDSAPHGLDQGRQECGMHDAAVRWPACLRDTTIPDFDMRREAFFAAMNDGILADVLPPAQHASPNDHAASTLVHGLLHGWPLITFSHFLPRPELHKGYALLEHFEGSHRLGEQVAELHRGANVESSAGVHVFGHTHFSIDMELDGIRYIQQPLGNPDERENGWQIESAMRKPSDALLTVWRNPTDSGKLSAATWRPAEDTGTAASLGALEHQVAKNPVGANGFPAGNMTGSSSDVSDALSTMSTAASSPPMKTKRVRILFWMDGFTVEDLSAVEDKVPSSNAKTPPARRTGVATLRNDDTVPSAAGVSAVSAALGSAPPRLRKYEEEPEFMHDLKWQTVPKELREMDHTLAGIPRPRPLEISIGDMRPRRYGDTAEQDRALRDLLSSLMPGATSLVAPTNAQSSSSFEAFSGAGQTLSGALTTAADAADTSPPASCGAAAWNERAAPIVDESVPTLMVQVRLASGGARKFKLNRSHTVADLKVLVEKALTNAGTTPRAYVLAAGFPPRPLADNDATLEAAGLAGAAVTQRWA